MNEETVALLKRDMMDEHHAVIQYLAHAYAMGEGVIAFEVEAIARDEMRHLDWLADAIVELGGTPTPERSTVDTSPGTSAENLSKNVALEEEAIAQYRAHAEAIEEPMIRMLIARILNDEIDHHAKFIKLAEEAKALAAAAPAGEPAAQPPKRLSEILNEGVRHEYTVILQYLFHGYASADKEFAERMQNIAINEMQHLGWLAEALEGKGGTPDLNHIELVLSDDPEVMLEADIAVEREVTRAYTEQIPEIEDDGTASLVAHIRDQEIFHDLEFGHMLDEVEAQEPAEPEPEPPQEAPPPAIPSVGSLKP